MNLTKLQTSMSLHMVFVFQNCYEVANNGFMNGFILFI